MRRTLSILICLFLASPVIAKPTKTPAQLAKEGERLHQKSEFEAALVLFEEAYKRSGNPRLLVNIAQCQRQLKRYQEALHSLEEYLAKEPTSEIRSQVKHLINDIQEKISPAPASMPSSEPTSAPSEPPTTLPIVGDPPAKKEEPPPWLTLPHLAATEVADVRKGPRLLYRSSLGMAAGGIVAAGLALQRGAALQEERAESGDDLASLSRGMHAFTISSELLLAASALSAGGAYVMAPNVRAPKVLYGASGLSAGLSGLFLGAALQSTLRGRALQAQSDPDVNEILFADERADVSRGLSVACFTGALLTGGVGYWLSQRLNEE